MKWVAVAALVTMGCSNCPETCTYVTREFKPAHEDKWVEMRCFSYNAKTGECSMQVPIYHSDFVPDKWFITYKDKKGSNHQDQVTKEQFDEKLPTVLHSHWRWSCKEN